MKPVECIAVGMVDGCLKSFPVSLTEYTSPFLETAQWECVDSDSLFVGPKAMTLNDAMNWGAQCRRKAGDYGWEATVYSDGSYWHVKFWKRRA